MELLPVVPLENYNHGEWSKRDERAHWRWWLCPPASQGYPGSGTCHAAAQMSNISKPRLCLGGDENPIDINLPDIHLKYHKKKKKRKKHHWYQEELHWFFSKLATLNFWLNVLLNFICRCLLFSSPPKRLYSIHLSEFHPSDTISLKVTVTPATIRTSQAPTDPPKSCSAFLKTSQLFRSLNMGFGDWNSGYPFENLSGQPFWCT